MSKNNATNKSGSNSRLRSNNNNNNSNNVNNNNKQNINPDLSRLQRFKTLLEAPNVDLESLKKISWSGVPAQVRPQTWKLLLGYLPTNQERRQSTLERKRNEYKDLTPHYLEVKEGRSTTSEDSATYHQIYIDVLRTHPLSPLFQQPLVQTILERILFLWAIRHPASGYVQGINDLVTPFFIVFLTEYVDGDVEECNIDNVAQENLENLEADCFWCMTKLLGSIQENYTFAQPGIQKMIFKLQELIGRIDAPLAKHINSQEAQYIQFAFRWMNCLLMREIPLRLIIRMWDTYLAEDGEFSTFHVYVCATFMVHWSNQLRKLEFNEMMSFLQHLPTVSWTLKDIDVLLSQAYLYKSLFHDAPSHLRES